MLSTDDEQAAGLILLRPVYRAGTSLDSVEARRRALRGFVFAPFQARGLFADLTSSQGRRLDVSLLEGESSQVLFTTRPMGSESRFLVGEN